MLDSMSGFLRSGAGLLTGMVALPVIFGVLLLIFRKRTVFELVAALLSSVINLVFALSLYTAGEFAVKLPVACPGFSSVFRVDGFSALFLVFTAFVFLLISCYTASFLRESEYMGRYFLYLYISISMINGALLSDNLGMMLFFWEGLLCTLVGMLLIRNMKNPKTAVKALSISGLADLLLMLGIIITASVAGTGNISEIRRLPLTGNGLIGFICILLGALGKAGAMPFHSWIPDAADDAPVVFMAAFPSALEKILGIYLTARIVIEVYDVRPGSGMSLLIMLIGTATILFAGAMALVQKDMKRLLAYSAISQLGYMILGIGTGLTIGIIGGLFHLMNHVLYKTGLFMIAGSVEKQTGTTDLRQLGGLRKKMPATTLCFLICALSIAGFPGFNGFFSKELIFDAALETNVVFYIGALAGAFLTALYLLKLGRTVFFGKEKLPAGVIEVREARTGMLAPIGILSTLCILFGVYNRLPLDGLLNPALGITESFSGWPHSVVLVAVSVAVLILAVVDHLYGSKKSGSALNALAHIHDAPGLKSVYALAEAGRFDPYNWLVAVAGVCSDWCVQIERGISWIYDTAVPGLVMKTGTALHHFDNGSLPRYLSLAVAGVAFIAVIFLIVLI